MSTATQTETKVNRLSDLGKRSDVVHINPRIIGIMSGHNPRDYHLPENRAHLDELKASIKENGFLPQFPISVFFDAANGGKVYVVDGECRLTACNELINDGVDIISIPTIQDKAKTPEERLFHALAANTGKPLSKWELGGAFKRLLNYGWTTDKIALKMGYKERAVNECIDLADAPEAIKHLLSEEAITPSLALSELRSKPSDEAVESIRAKVAATRAEGKKTAKRDKEKVLPNPKTMVNLISKLVGSVQDDIFDDEHKFVEVDKSTMRKLAALVGIKEKKE